jgi:hypothetical protein
MAIATYLYAVNEGDLIFYEGGCCLISGLDLLSYLLTPLTSLTDSTTGACDFIKPRLILISISPSVLHGPTVGIASVTG